jgi:hypothetical protein
MRRFMKKRVYVALTAVAALAIAGAAFAFFSSTGTGTGTATTGKSTLFAVVSTPDTLADLVPNNAIGSGVIDTVSYSVTNPSTGKQSLTQVVAKVANTDGSTWTSQTILSKPACTAGDFSISGTTVGLPYTSTEHAGDLTAGQTVNNTDTLQMVDNGLNQDNCQNVTVPLYFSAS